MLLLRCVSYIVSFQDMFQLYLLAISRLVTFLRKLKCTLGNAIVIFIYDFSLSCENLNNNSTV